MTNRRANETWGAMRASSSGRLLSDVIAGVIAGLVAGVILAFVSYGLTSRQLDNERRLSNAAYVREVSRDVGGGPRTFAYLDLKGMNISGLLLPCRDDQIVEWCADRADFTGADLRDAQMQYMDLNGALFAGADLRGVDFSGSDLGGVDFSDAQLDGIVLDHSCWHVGTYWGGEFEPPSERRTATVRFAKGASNGGRSAARVAATT